jgi:hypothetical protein
MQKSRVHVVGSLSFFCGAICTTSSRRPVKDTIVVRVYIAYTYTYIHRLYKAMPTGTWHVARTSVYMYYTTYL